MTYELVRRVKVENNAESIVFNSIPQDGSDLFIVISGRGTNTGSFNSSPKISFNGSGGPSVRTYAARIGFTAEFVSDEIGVLPGGQTAANTFGFISLLISNYRSTTNKSIGLQVHQVAGNPFHNLSAGIYDMSAAITSITFTVQGENWGARSSISLYKITRGSTPGVTVS